MHLCQLVKIQAHIFLKINMDTHEEFWLDKMADGENKLEIYRANKKTEQLKVLATKYEDLSSIPRMSKAEGEH